MPLQVAKRLRQEATGAREWRTDTLSLHADRSEGEMMSKAIGRFYRCSVDFHARAFFAHSQLFTHEDIVVCCHVSSMESAWTRSSRWATRSSASSPCSRMNFVTKFLTLAKGAVLMTLRTPSQFPSLRKPSHGSSCVRACLSRASVSAAEAHAGESGRRTAGEA